MNIEIGIVPAMITPLNEDETVDIESVGSLVEWMLGFDIKGLFVGGTVGEGIALSDSERATLFREVVRVVRGRVPVLAGVSDVGTRRVLNNIAAAADEGVDAVVATPRMTFPSRTRGETFRMFSELAAGSPAPVWFYENPVVTSVTSTFEEIAELMAIDNIEGLKYSATDFPLFKRCVTELPGSPPCFNGNVPEIAMTAEIGGGVICGNGSMLPGLCIETYNCARAGETEKAEKLQEAIKATYAIYNHGGENWPLWPSAQKHVLMRRGVIRTNFSTHPFVRISPEAAAYIDRVIDEQEALALEPELSG